MDKWWDLTNILFKDTFDINNYSKQNCHSQCGKANVFIQFAEWEWGGNKPEKHLRVKLLPCLTIFFSLAELSLTVDDLIIASFQWPFDSTAPWDWNVKMTFIPSIKASRVQTIHARTPWVCLMWSCVVWRWPSEHRALAVCLSGISLQMSSGINV